MRAGSVKRVGVGLIGKLRRLIVGDDGKLHPLEGRFFACPVGVCLQRHLPVLLPCIEKIGFALRRNFGGIAASGCLDRLLADNMTTVMRLRHDQEKREGLGQVDHAAAVVITSTSFSFSN